jgi:hypothetical protein
MGFRFYLDLWTTATASSLDAHRTMGAGGSVDASKFTSVEDAVEQGVPQEDIDAYLAKQSPSGENGQDQAALAIQNKHRQKQAKTRVQQLKLVVAPPPPPLPPPPPASFYTPHSPSEVVFPVLLLAPCLSPNGTGEGMTTGPPVHALLLTRRVRPLFFSSSSRSTKHPNGRGGR